jgi:hypothetical protein
MHLAPVEPKTAFFVAAGLALSPFACGGRANTVTETADAAGSDVSSRDDGSVVDGDDDAPDSAPQGRDASPDGPNDVWDVLGDAMDAPGDATQCTPGDPPAPVIASTAVITFQVSNSASADRFVLTQATECEAYSVEGETTLIPYQCGCQCGAVPPEQLYFTRLAPGASTTLPWDARALAMYYSYDNCRPEKPYCSSITHGSLQPVPAASYVVDFASAASVPSGNGTNCTVVNGGDVSCIINAQIQLGGQCNPNNIGLQITTVSQSFAVPASGTVTVEVDVP